ncbi:uncharacterized protein LOC125663885 [Ostrea edulis]|uniref:uncharacterized protein LOC125663885 n=1 Tax=Ostrea edulis TaxID=37623 RepID=UPI002094F396|nr:uncharacterized protein LOC125663885 [Ostrea edulis]
MLVSGITSSLLIFFLLVQTEAKPTTPLRQKRAPGYQFPRLGRSQEYTVNKRPLQFPRLGGKRSSTSTNFDSFPDTNVEEILPVINHDLLDILHMDQNDFPSQEIDQGFHVNKRKIQFPRLGRKRSYVDDEERMRAYADKMISEADTQIDQDVLKKLISLLNTKGDSQSDTLIII